MNNRTGRVASGPMAVSGPKTFSLSDVRSAPSGLPKRYILHAVEGFGKTSLAAQAPKPIFLMTRGETGLDTLMGNGQLPETAHLPELMSWEDTHAALDFIRKEDHDFSTLVIDTLNGAERLCHQFVCHRDFADDWSDKGFLSYGRGPESAVADWLELLGKLDAIRAERRMTIFCLCHTKVQGFKNPEGNDYDRYQPDMNKHTWSATHKWADVVLFGNFEVTVNTKKNAKVDEKGKGTGGTHRVIYTERTAAYDAKNRLGLPVEIDASGGAAQAWVNFNDALRAAREKQQNG